MPMALFYLLALAFILPNLFEAWDFLGDKTVKYLTAFFSIAMLINGLRPFFHKHHVQWNKRGITIRVNSFLGTNFSFDNIRNIVYAEDTYTVYTHSGRRPSVINLEGVDQKSKEGLLHILQQHTLSPVQRANG